MSRERRFYVDISDDGQKRLGVVHGLNGQLEIPLATLEYKGRRLEESSKHDSPFSSDRTYEVDIYMDRQGKEYRFIVEIVEDGQRLLS